MRAVVQRGALGADGAGILLVLPPGLVRRRLRPDGISPGSTECQPSTASTASAVLLLTLMRMRAKADELCHESDALVEPAKLVSRNQAFGSGKHFGRTDLFVN